ncbi:YbaY family lipoprotein [Polymorphobacter arshaanensis]|nr:YbaY family lipoprotein [Polymorphobacter arshaanensis]
MFKYLIALLLAAPAAAVPFNPDAAIEVKAAFICADGREVEVLFRRPTQVALIDGPNGQIVLYKTVATKGYKYIGGENEISGDGETASYRVFPRPRVQCHAKPSQTVPGTLTGTITYRERIALPEGATATVEIRDVSRADAPAPLLSSTTITPTGNQVPLHWIMTFDPAKVAPQASYSVSARINDKAGKLMWVSDTIEPALTRGAPADFIDVDLVRAK